jgi:hypothetical protein
MRVANTSSKEHGFDMDDFVKVDFDNKVQSLKHIRRDGYWEHFATISKGYYCLMQDLRLQSDSQEVMSHYFSNCSINYVKGITNVLGGHHTDSSIFIRKTIESVRYATFIKNDPDVIQFWGAAEGKNEFKNRYKDWFYEGEGRLIVKKQYPDSDEFYKRATTYGPHANYDLFAVQHTPTKDGVRVLYTEIENNLMGYLNLLSMYFWHLRVHAGALKWWLHESGFIHCFSKEDLAAMDVGLMEIESDYENVINRISIHRFGLPKSKLPVK